MAARRGLPTQELPSSPIAALRESYGGVEAGVKAPQPSDEYYLRRFIANGFSLALCCAFGTPVIILIKLASDQDVAFWIGEWGYFAILVWVIILAQHIAHLFMLRTPHLLQRSIFFAVPIACSVILMSCGAVYYTLGRYYHGQLKSSDCSESTVYAKYWLQQAYDQAHVVYDRCQSRLLAENEGYPLLRQPPLQNCEEWRDFLDARKGEKLESWAAQKLDIKHVGGLKQFSSSNFALEWEYLAWVEAEHICGGFCERGPSLFVSYDRMGRDGGACASQVAFKLISVYDNGFIVIVISLLIFAVTIPTYIYSIPQLSAIGYLGNKANQENGANVPTML